MRTTLTRRMTQIVITSVLAAFTFAVPNPVSTVTTASAAAQPVSAITWGAKQIQLQMGYELLSSSPPDLDAFDLRVDGVRITITSLDYSIAFLYLNYAESITGGKTVTLTYTAPTPVDNTKNNMALQDKNGGDTVTFTMTVINTQPVVSEKPSKPGIPTVVAGAGSATITVTPPSSGKTPTSYVVTANPGGKTCTVTGSSGSCTITGLTPGTAYTFTTVAINAAGSSVSGTASSPVTVLASGGASSGQSSGPRWDIEPAADSEVDAYTEGFMPTVIPGDIIITDEFGFVIDKNNGIKPKLRSKNYAGKIKLTISAKYKDGATTKNYKCKFAPFGATKKSAKPKWQWHTPKKACILPAALVTALQKGTTTLNAKGKWARQWSATGSKARPDKSKIKPRKLKYTVRAKPATL